MRDNDYSHAMLGNIIRDAIDGAYLREQEVYEDQCVGLMDNNIGEKRAPSKHRLMPSSSGAARSSAKTVRGVTIIEFNGEHLTVAEWAERLGVAKNSLEVRLMRGWSVERALTKPFAAPRTGRANRRPPKISHH